MSDTDHLTDSLETEESREQTSRLSRPHGPTATQATLGSTSSPSDLMFTTPVLGRFQQEQGNQGDSDSDGDEAERELLLTYALSPNRARPGARKSGFSKE